MQHPAPVDASSPNSTQDLWAPLRAATPARIGLERTGDATALQHVLAFQHAHARARDAVHAPFDVARLAAALSPEPTILVQSRAADRVAYLRRPNLGRQLDPAVHDALVPRDYDAVFIIADGLSATAVDRHALPLLAACRERLGGWRLAPVVLARQSRVALGDEIGERLGARLSVMLIGERPGLTVADSLSIYITFEPRRGRTDAERNCILNIYQFYVFQRGGSGRRACMSIAIRRRPRVKYDSLERATLAGWRFISFFRRGWDDEPRPIALWRQHCREQGP